MYNLERGIENLSSKFLKITQLQTAKEKKNKKVLHR
ncbi:MAG: hypothetical protein CM15mP11_09830 [Gammaproteobacteria bacterium]|nr:MAG: hypothetical protein CM15mP11_09830 [Gammaproteobacteria bacterium]